jgi:hypothetical protein
MKMKKALETKILLALVAAATLVGACARAEDLESGFRAPPPAARPWVYWFWLNGNITSNGITADLEAMKRVGIGGALIMEVDQGAPVGPVDFMGDQWRGLFRFVHAEATRLGLQINMNNDAGWDGSGGPWIKPEESMQEITWSETKVTGPLHFEGTLSQPRTTAGFYRDIAVLAFPVTGDYRIPDTKAKALFQREDLHQSGKGELTPESIIVPASLVDLTPKVDASGKLVWDAPAGEWTILRLGHTSTGAVNAPAPKTGRGLECDKLSLEGIRANFAGMMAKLACDTGIPHGSAAASGTRSGGLVASHIDSWENGVQNWTAKMREEFKKRRGYDLTSFLPVFTGRVVDSLEASERFLWDVRKTVSELVIENYAGGFHRLANASGMRFTVEAYGGPCDDIPYGGQADEPMGEFWTPGGGMLETCRGMASAGHLYGKRIIGAESFTSGDPERWREHPAVLKALGDRAFCEGINRFVFHRFAMQPWTNYAPGMTMGPWGQHYERTETWWEYSRPWHEYLARCQYLLRQGLFVADICHLQAEEPPLGCGSYPRPGYDWDECTDDAVFTRMSVHDGCIELPDGMSYRLLALSDSRAMTPRLLSKLKDLVEAGATIVGPRPVKSPSLSNYPHCDDQVRQLAGELWGDCDGERIKEHAFGRGRVVWGIPLEDVLQKAGVKPDFICGQPWRFNHRHTAKEDIYFVANSKPFEATTTCAFRVTGKLPELWFPETGRIETAVVYEMKDGVTRLPLTLGPSGSVFVVFRQSTLASDPIVAVRRGDKTLLSAVPNPLPRPLPKVIVNQARYGVLNDPQRTRDVTQKAQAMVDSGESTFQVARMAAGEDPAPGVVKTLEVDYTFQGKRLHLTATDPEDVDLVTYPVPPKAIVQIHVDAQGRLSLEASDPGDYEILTASGGSSTVQVPPTPEPVDLSSDWEVSFDPKWGGPEHATFAQLRDWSERPEDGIRYYSGTAVYRKTFVLNAPTSTSNHLWLDLGKVAVMAEPKLNGKNLGILWKPPFRVNLDGAAVVGENHLEIKVVNLWINRMIGDEQLPGDSQRNGDGTLKVWPAWVNEGKVSPTGRFTFTSWRLWKKTDALVPSGLLGPVTIQTIQQMALH